MMQFERFGYFSKNNKKVTFLSTFIMVKYIKKLSSRLMKLRQAKKKPKQIFVRFLVDSKKNGFLFFLIRKTKFLSTNQNFHFDYQTTKQTWQTLFLKLNDIHKMYPKCLFLTVRVLYTHHMLSLYV